METTADRLITYREAAALLRLGESTLRRYVSEGRIPFIKLMGSVRFSERRLMEWVDQRAFEPPK